MFKFFIVSAIFVLFNGLCTLAQQRPRGTCNVQIYNPIIRPCEGGRDLPRELCERRGCCFTPIPRPYCFQRLERNVPYYFRPSQIPSVLPGQNSGIISSLGLTFGGEPNYPGSSIQRRCGARGRRCAFLSILPYRGSRNGLLRFRAVCGRFGCCYNARRRTCYFARYHVTELRRTCAPGFENPPACTDINDCASRPCQNSGNCIDGIQSFECTCPQGIGGATCTQVCLTIPDAAPPNVATIMPSTGPLNTNDIVSYTCPMGSVLVGSNVITCQADGTFSPQPPTCLQDCPEVPLITDILASLNRPYSPGESFTYACEPMFAITDANVVNTCNGNGVWTIPPGDPRLPTCTPPCPNPPPSVQLTDLNVATGLLVSPTHSLPSNPPPFAIGDTVTFSCVDAEKTNTAAESTCVQTGSGPEWDLTSANVGVCMQTRCLPPTAVPPNSGFQLSLMDPPMMTSDTAFDEGTSLTYFCLPTFGTRLTVPERTTTCNLPNFSWTLDPTINANLNCQPACGPPPERPDVMTMSLGTEGPPNYFFFDTMVTDMRTRVLYECPSPLILSGSNTINTCQSDGTWSITDETMLPECNCPAIPIGTIMNIDTAFLSMTFTPSTMPVMYICATGYRVVPEDASNTCSSAGWSNVDASGIQCVQQCSDPIPNIFVGTTLQAAYSLTTTPPPGNFPYVEGTTVMYTCPPGFTIDNPALAENMCTNGMWSRTMTLMNLPVCRANDPDVNMILLLDASGTVDSRCPTSLVVPIPDDGPVYAAIKSVASEIFAEWVAFTSARSTVAVALISSSPGGNGQCEPIITFNDNAMDRTMNLAAAETLCGNIEMPDALICAEDAFLPPGTLSPGFKTSIPTIAIVVQPFLSDGIIATTRAFLMSPVITFSTSLLFYVAVGDGPIPPDQMTMIMEFLAKGDTGSTYLGQVGLSGSAATVVQTLRGILPSILSPATG